MHARREIAAWKTVDMPEHAARGTVREGLSLGDDAATLGPERTVVKS
jgi:hypothetical protein